LKIPLWFLRLLPMWDYICPKCKKEVKKKSHTCPYCKENYGVPLRVPPRVLKDKKALEDYVHKYVFPRISAKQREYLAQYFTELFSDGFESGDFSAWDGTANYYGSSSIVLSPVYQGSYAAKFTCTDDSVGAYGVAYKNLGSAYSTIHMRVYLRISALPNGARFGCYKLRNAASAGDQFYVGVLNDAGTEKWGVFVEYTDTWYTYTEDITLDTWYCIEVKIVRDSSNGEVHLWRNGTEIITETGINTGANDMDKVYAGYQHTSSMGGSGALVDVYVDCVVVADTYIGPIPSYYYKDQPLKFLPRFLTYEDQPFKVLVSGIVEDYYDQVFKNLPRLESYTDQLTTALPRLLSYKDTVVKFQPQLQEQYDQLLKLLPKFTTYADQIVKYNPQLKDYFDQIFKVLVAFFVYTDQTMTVAFFVYTDQTMTVLPRLTLHDDQIVKTLPRLASQLDQIIQILPRLVGYRDLVVSVEPKLTEFMDETVKVTPILTGYKDQPFWVSIPGENSWGNILRPTVQVLCFSTSPCRVY